jgi:cytoskeletal protein CcmA (bactofilin family)
MMAEKIEKKNITVLGAETEFEGNLTFTDKLVVTGKFTGKIESDNGDLQIAKNAVCNVESLNVNSVVIYGDVKGQINATERVEICSGSIVEGDVKTARVRIANNVDFNGQVTMLETEPEIDLFSVASDEYKKAMLVHSDVIK